MSDKELIDNFVKQYHSLKSEMGKVIVGQDKAVDSLLLSIFTGGHCLLVGVPQSTGIVIQPHPVYA